MTCNICHKPRVSMQVTHVRGVWKSVEVVCRSCQRWAAGLGVKHG